MSHAFGDILGNKPRTPSFEGARVINLLSKRGAESQSRTDTWSPPPVFEFDASTISRLLILNVEPEDSLVLTIERTSASSCFGKGLWKSEIEYILRTSTTGAELVIDGGMTAQ